MTPNQALIVLEEMKLNQLVAKMIYVVKTLGRVPKWVENEIAFSKVRGMENILGSNSGNAFVYEDMNYHGGYVE